MNKLLLAVVQSSVILVLLGPAPAVAQTAESRSVGEIGLVRFWGYGRMPEQTAFRDVFARDRVVFGETLRTPEDAAIHVRFDDGSDLRLGERTELLIDTFVYDPATRTGELAVELTKGVLRFISGRMKEDRIRFRTPVATVGILGTDVWIEVLADGTTIVDVKEGRVTVVPRAGGGPIVLDPGVNAYVDGASGAATTGPREVVRDPGLNVDAGMDAGGPK